MNQREPVSGKIAELELIPGHPLTQAEVWLWSGRLPGITEGPAPWVVLHSDDWPMSADAARQLAAALTGLTAIDPQWQEQRSLPAGRHVLLCFVADEQTGIPHTFMGMHQVITLH